MELRYKTYDTEEKGLYIGVNSHYFNLSDARQVYRESKYNEKNKDDTILIEIAKDGANEVEAVVRIGVEEGERLALTLLNLCDVIKR
jgi:hypothetical protein